MAKLTAVRVKAVKPKPDKTLRLGDGDGLYFVVRPTGSRAWVLRVQQDGKRRDKGLGKFPTVSLAEAREKAATIRAAVKDQVGQRPAAPTFREAAEEYIERNAGRWKNRKEAVNWRGCMESYAYPVFGHVRVDEVDRQDVLRVLTPIWTATPSIARKLRQRIRAIFRRAMAFGYLDINPAGEVIEGGLEPIPAVKAHFRALPYQDVADALAVVDASTAGLSAKLCFRWLVLTAARSGEARGATWSEIDMNAATWAVPASRMKAGREHRVPLSEQALDVLQEARSLDDSSGLIFPSPMKPGRELSDMTLTKVLRCTGLAERATVHGFRTSFKTWCMETTNTPWAVGEAALAHTIGNSTEAAYARSDLFERRRTLMQEWAAYVTGGALPEGGTGG